MRSKKPLYWIKKSLLLQQQWLMREKIFIEINDLSEMHCPKIGFLTNSHPIASMLPVYAERIQSIVPKTYFPDFTLTIENMACKNWKCKVIKVKA